MFGRKVTVENLWKHDMSMEKDTGKGFCLFLQSTAGVLELQDGTLLLDLPLAMANLSMVVAMPPQGKSSDCDTFNIYAIMLSNNMISDGLPALLRRLDNLSPIILDSASSLPTLLVDIVHCLSSLPTSSTLIPITQSFRKSWRCTCPNSPPQPGSECRLHSPGGTRRWESYSNLAQVRAIPLGKKLKNGLPTKNIQISRGWPRAPEQRRNTFWRRCTTW